MKKYNSSYKNLKARYEQLIEKTGRFEYALYQITYLKGGEVIHAPEIAKVALLGELNETR